MEQRYFLKTVAPLVGARIEIQRLAEIGVNYIVAPLVGARIEIYIGVSQNPASLCRSPRGSED